MPKNIPALFHDLRGYNSDLIIQEISKFDVKISVTVNGLKKYIAFTVHRNSVFIDSMHFMNSGLDELAIKLPGNGFNYFSQELSGQLLELVKQKGVYPFELMNSFKGFFDDKLPHCVIYSSLKDKCVSEKNYLHAVNVWNAFKIKTMGDYHDLYLKTDFLLLADVFEKFIGV